MRSIPGDVQVDRARNVDADHLAAEMLARVDEVDRHAPFAQDALVVVDVVHEGVEGADTLRDAALQPCPLVGGENVRGMRSNGKTRLVPTSSAYTVKVTPRRRSAALIAWTRAMSSS